MPHMFLPRPRKYAVWIDPSRIKEQFPFEVMNAIFYDIGGIMFVIGSIFFLPTQEENLAVGSWLFAVGSILFLTVSLQDFVEIVSQEYGKSESFWLDFTAESLYILGSVLYILGSIWFLPTVGRVYPAAWTFIVGSGLFVGGAALNACQIFQAKTVWASRMMNLVAICFVIGSTMFTCGSVPFLFSFESEQDAEKIGGYLGWMFIVGSFFFLVGGIINHVKVYFLYCQECKECLGGVCEPGVCEPETS